MCERKALDTCHKQDCFNSKRFQAGLAIDVIDLSLSTATDGVCHTAVWAEQVKMHWSCAPLNIDTHIQVSGTLSYDISYHLCFNLVDKILNSNMV